MNVVLHLVRKEAILWAWVIALWFALGVCAMVVEIANPPASSPYYPLLAFSLTVQALLAAALLAWIIQEDSLRDPLAFWRSRPIPPGALLKAKLSLLGILFVATPAAALVVVELVSPGKRGGVDAFLPTMIFLSAAVLGGSALAACTKNLGEYLLIGVTCLVAENYLTTWWRDHAEIPSNVVRTLGESRSLVAAIVIFALSVVALLIQYHRRRTLLSVGVVALAVVSSALIRSFWTWRFV